MCWLAAVLNRSDHKTVEFLIRGEVGAGGQRGGRGGEGGVGSKTASLVIQRWTCKLRILLVKVYETEETYFFLAQTL